MDELAEQRALVARLRAGDYAALEPLYRRHADRALRAAYLIVHDRATAEDLVQAAFLRAYERIDQFDDGRPFGPWFLRIVVNDARKAAQRRERTVPLEAPDSPNQMSLLDRLAADVPGPEAAAERAELRRAVWNALRTLPPPQRAAVVQRYYLGLSEAELSERLHAPLGTVKSRLFAARERLRRLLRPAIAAPAAPARSPTAEPPRGPSHR